MQRFILVLATALCFTTTAQAADIKPTTQAGSAKITLSAARVPLKVGKNVLTVNVSDTQGKPLTSKDFKAAITQSAKEMEMMGMGGMGIGSAKAEVKALTPGVYEIKTTLPFGGKWDLQVTLNDTKPPASASFSFPVK
jgi:YtkA-like